MKKKIILLFLLITITNLKYSHAGGFIENSLSAENSAKDSIAKTTKPAGSFLKSKVKYDSRDSIRFDVGEQKVYLFGDAQVTYESIKLNAAYIELNLKDNIVFAQGIKDSLGKEKGTPVFEEAGQAFSSRKMTYNFKSKKGKIIDVITKESDGYIHGETVKKDSSNVFCILHGKYTTCDLPHPHFYIGASKLKVIPNDKIITGPANLIVADVPTPLVLPFGFFPNRKGQASGILIPAYGESQALGFFLQDGGYYLGLSDRMDMAIKGTIYSKQSWALKDHVNYSNRYKYNGFVDLTFKRTVIDDLEAVPKAQKDFSFLWKHTQDPKARPNTAFSADVNIISGGTFNKYSVASPNDFLKNTYASNVQYSKSWAGTPFRMSINARHSQNTITKIVDLTLPSLSFGMNTIYPFAKKSRLESRWYDKINMNYSAIAENKISTYDSLLFKPDVLQKMQNGVKHSIPISTSFTFLKYFNVNPSASTHSTWYLQTYEKRYDPIKKTTVTDTINGFKMANDYNLSTSLTTNLYGNYYFKHSSVKQIRHMMTPSIGFSYTPDFSEPAYGYYKTVQTDSTGKTQKYSIFQGIYGAPSSAKSGSVSLALNQNLEMKVKSKNDTVATDKKIKLIDNLSISTSYNMAAEHFQWSAINFRGSTKLFKTIDANFGGVFDQYALNTLGQRVDRFQWNANQKPGRLTSASLNLSGNLKNGTPKKKTSEKGSKEELEYINSHLDAYVDFNVPWSLSINYTLTYLKPAIRDTFMQSVSFRGDFSLTPKWKVSFSNLGYDFASKNFTSPSVIAYRDLHCWDLSLNWVPFGIHQSYNLTIKVKSAVLQDLKLTRKREFIDY